MFGSVIWAGLILVLLTSAIELYDERLAMLIVLVTMFALFIAHADQIVAVLQAMTPRAGG